LIEDNIEGLQELSELPSEDMDLEDNKRGNNKGDINWGSS